VTRCRSDAFPADRFIRKLIGRQQTHVRSVARQRHIGKLLLKNETDELDRVRAAAEDAVSQQFEEIRRFSHTREPPEGRQGAESLCEGERAACVACLGDTKDALKCSESIRAYVNCANELMQH